MNADIPVAVVHARPRVREQVPHGLEISHLGNPVKDNLLITKQAGCQRGQGGIFRAADGKLSAQRRAAPYFEFVHR
jgi:hypothetical protein